MMWKAGLLCKTVILLTQNGTQQFVWPRMLLVRRRMVYWRDLLPDLDQGVAELVDSLKCNLVASAELKNYVPEFVCWI